MVIHDVDKCPQEMLKCPKSDEKGNDLEQDHVTELPVSIKSNIGSQMSVETCQQDKLKHKKRKPIKATKKEKPKEFGPESDSAKEVQTEISKEDLEELRNVYKKCKRVLHNIETKYGHLLGLDHIKELEERKQKRKCDLGNTEDVQCNCSMKKKIIFDDEGQQLLKETTLDKHVCPKKLMKAKDTVNRNDFDKSNVEIEIADPIILPDDLKSLAKILQDSSIDITYRNTAVEKVRRIKLEHLNEIRFNRPNLIEKVKLNVNEVLDFKGTNLETLSGYPIWK